MFFDDCLSLYFLELRLAMWESPQEFCHSSLHSFMISIPIPQAVSIFRYLFRGSTMGMGMKRAYLGGMLSLMMQSAMEARKQPSVRYRQFFPCRQHNLWVRVQPLYRSISFKNIWVRVKSIYQFVTLYNIWVRVEPMYQSINVKNLLLWWI